MASKKGSQLPVATTVEDNDSVIIVTGTSPATKRALKSVLLDGLATIASMMDALAGKANALHSHLAEDITDFDQKVEENTASQFAVKITGPASATDNAVARFDGTSGKTVQGSSVTIADDGSMIVQGLSSVNSTTANTIEVDQNGDVGNSSKTDGAIHIENTGAPGIGLGVYSNAATTTGHLVEVWMDNPSSTMKTMFVRQDGVDAAIEVQKTTNGVNSFDPALYLNVSHTGANGGALKVQDSSVAPSIEIAKAGSAAHFRLTGDPSPASPQDGDFWFDGTDLKIRIGSTTYKINLTAI